MTKNHLYFLIILLLALAGCKDPYEVELRSTDRSLLVVEGFLNKGAPSRFRLSRTVLISDKNQLKPELQAVVTVEGRDNSVAPFADKGAGLYEASLPHLEVGKDYRLRIRTLTGKEYLSDYVTVKNNPPIDSVSWRQEEDGGVRIYVSTHDPANETHYYRWDYEETWEQRSNYKSLFKYTGDTVIERNLIDDDVYTCWRTVPSTNILLASSAQLQADVIHESPLTFVPLLDERLAHRYSILVRQYSLSREAYEYFQLMRKNTESLGSIFDAQPSEITGNIHSVSEPEEPVVGYITASAVQETRIFISRQDDLVGDWFSRWCPITYVANNRTAVRNAFSGNILVPFEADYHPTNPNIIIGYYASSAVCVSCTSRGGTNVKPSFW